MPAHFPLWPLCNRSNAGLLPAEARNRIEMLLAGSGDDSIKARIQMLVYMLGRIAGEADVHGVPAQPKTIADLLIVDLAGEPELRRKLPLLLEDLQEQGAVIEVGGEWRLQTKESAECEASFQVELADQAGITRTGRELLDYAIEAALSGSSIVLHGTSRVYRRIHRLRADEKAPFEVVILRLRSRWEEDIASVESRSASATDATLIC